MNKTKYNQLREEIILAVPEIEKLCNGCEVMASLCENDVPIDDYKMDTFIIGKKDTFKKCKANGLTYIIHNQREYELYKIIGRDILLEDCLIAIEKKGYRVDLGNSYNRHIDAFIGWKIMVWKKDKTGEGGGFIGDIGVVPNIPLQDQSDETKDLLWDLICKDG